MNSEQIVIDGTIDARVEKVMELKNMADNQRDMAKESKDKATKIYKMRDLRANYYSIQVAIEKARAMSLDEQNIHFIAIDTGDGPMAQAAYEWANYVYYHPGEYEIYAVYRNGEEVEGFTFNTMELNHERSVTESGDGHE